MVGLSLNCSLPVPGCQLIPGNLALGEMTGTLWRTFDLQELCQVMEQRQEPIQHPDVSEIMERLEDARGDPAMSPKQRLNTMVKPLAGKNCSRCF